MRKNIKESKLNTVKHKACNEKKNLNIKPLIEIKYPFRCNVIAIFNLV